MANYFCGWYFKMQSPSHTLALIPAYHSDEDGNRSASLQVISDSGSWNVPYPREALKKERGTLDVHLAENHFSMHEVVLNLSTDTLTLHGRVTFSEPTPLKYDIMGPFKYVPRMECRHSVYSMRHTVDGCFFINGERYEFNNAIGYIEGDRGYSFPSAYAWSQCSFEENSLMLSLADIPYGPLSFRGVISAVLWQGREYRLATYLGAKGVRIGNKIEIQQGPYLLSARLISKSEHRLRAPVQGRMSRTIGESPAARAHYLFQENGKTLFEFETDRASFEFEL